MMDPRKLGQMLMGEWDKTKQPLKERATMLPLGQYEDGSVGLAWPGLLADPIQRGYQAANTPIPPINDDAAWADKSAAMFDAASLAPIGGVAAAVASRPKPGIRAYRGAASETIAPSTMENPGTVWSSTSPDVANFYAERAAGYADNDGLVMPLNIRGKLKTEGPWFGTQQWSPEWQAKIDAAVADGYDGVRFRNVSDTVDGVTSDWIATARPETMYSATTGEKLYSNSKDAALPGLLANALEQPQGIRAYHGSPHDFDRFDLSKIGTGSGDALDGRGVYLTDYEADAVSYKRPDLRHNAFNPQPKFSGDGHMYETRINANETDFLPTRDAVDKLPQSVQEIVSKRFTEGDEWAAQRPLNFYLARDPSLQSEIANLGYQGLRAARNGSNEYVVFNPEIIDILRKYANAPTGSVPGLAAQAGQEDQNPALLDYLRSIGLAWPGTGNNQTVPPGNPIEEYLRQRESEHLASADSNDQSGFNKKALGLAMMLGGGGLSAFSGLGIPVMAAGGVTKTLGWIDSHQAAMDRVLATEAEQGANMWANQFGPDDPSKGYPGTQSGPGRAQQLPDWLTGRGMKQPYENGPQDNTDSPILQYLRSVGLY